MPVKDHLTGLKSTSTSFKPAQQRDKNDYVNVYLSSRK